MAEVSDEQKRFIEECIKQLGLNEFGDPRNTAYIGGTPLFNEMSGETTDRFVYILKNHPEWKK